MKLVNLLISVFFIFSVTSLQANEATEITFKEGSVLIRCGTPPGQNNHISDALFESTFPHLMAALQQRANEGLVSRAHYLGALKQGIFIVVSGDDKEQALENSKVVMSDLSSIMEKAIKETGEAPPFSPEEACLIGEIGPVAILPK